MEELTKNDLHFVVSRIPKDVRGMLKKYPSLMIGGGFIRGTIAREKISDIDLFGPDANTLKMAAQDIALQRKGRIHETNNALTVLAPPRMPLQFITRWCFDNPTALIKSFDYTVCQAAISMTVENIPESDTGAESGGSDIKTRIDWHGHCAQMFYPDLAARRLNYTFPQRNEDAGGSLLRMRKFIERGYSIQAGSMARVIARLVSKVDWQGFENWKDEKYAAKIITGLLREVDPLALIDGIEMVDEHEIEGI
jgi:hypothetical protein